MKLSNYTQGRDNNFNLIRIIAALAVLVTHSFALAIGTADAEPLREKLGMTLGSIAVDVFFITSGFLVTASLINRQSTIEFIWARAFRIFPALIVMLLLTVFVMSVAFTTLPTLAYLSSPEIYIYLGKCATLISGVVYTLPGVFENNPYKSAVNGSLWTMPWEIRMYAILAAAWLVLCVVPQSRLALFQRFVVILACVFGVGVFISHFYVAPINHKAMLFFMFFLGAAFYVLREKIVLTRWAYYFCMISLGLATLDKEVFFVVYVIAIAYVLFYLAYVPSGFIRKYNQLGDYSYGIYIYAFPVQQSVAQLMPGVSVLQMVLISAVATSLLAIFSWHFLEQRALRYKAHYIGHTRRLLEAGLLKMR